MQRGNIPTLYRLIILYTLINLSVLLLAFVYNCKRKNNGPRDAKQNPYANRLKVKRIYFAYHIHGRSHVYRTMREIQVDRAQHVLWLIGLVFNWHSPLILYTGWIVPMCILFYHRKRALYYSEKCLYKKKKNITLWSLR